VEVSKAAGGLAQIPLELTPTFLQRVAISPQPPRAQASRATLKKAGSQVRKFDHRAWRPDTPNNSQQARHALSSLASAAFPWDGLDCFYTCKVFRAVPAAPEGPRTGPRKETEVPVFGDVGGYCVGQPGTDPALQARHILTGCHSFFCRVHSVNLARGNREAHCISKSKSNRLSQLAPGTARLLPRRAVGLADANLQTKTRQGPGPDRQPPHRSNRFTQYAVREECPQSQSSSRPMGRRSVRTTQPAHFTAFKFSTCFFLRG
jgi:hypothetical protein